MLSAPRYGWTDYFLEGTGVYSLSYLDDIAVLWLDQAIHGLKTMQPFCVKGFLEPNRFLCLVSYWNCHIVIEDDERYMLEEDGAAVECSHTSMLEFCRALHRDISGHLDEWAAFADYGGADTAGKKKNLLQDKLKTLETLIVARAEYFGNDRCFL